MTELDRRLVLATQSGLPMDARPYHWLANELGVLPDTIMERLGVMLDDGRIRRIGVVPNHYRLGYVANGMTVWDVPDEHIDELGAQVGETGICQPLLSPAAPLPDWPYNLFAMVHGHSRSEAVKMVESDCNTAG